MGALKARLQTILKPDPPAIGFLTDAGLNVTIWDTTKPTGAASYTQINIRDVKDTLGDESWQGAGQLQVHTLTIELDLVHLSSQDDASELRKMISDIYLAVGSDEQFGMPGVVIQTNPMSDEILVSQEELKAVGARVTLELQYRTQKWEN